MRFSRVCLASVGYCIPPVIVTSGEIERRLAEVYQRLRLPEGRLEGMSGIRERRLWAPGSRLSDQSILSCRRAIQAAGIDPGSIGALIHASVCREYLEPATACRVHHALGLPASAWVYDVSNACLGILNGAAQIAQLIEAGVIRAGLVVGTEDSRGLMEATLAQLQQDSTLTRQSIKPAFASLTIGSGSCAWLLADRDCVQGAPVHAMVARAHTQHHGLCQSDQDRAGAATLPTMQTDSEQLLNAGIEAGVATYRDLCQEIESDLIARRQAQRVENAWDWDATVCHQVGSAHRTRMLQSLALDPQRDFATFPYLGNTGSVALPTALGVGLLAKAIPRGSRAALLGIGSGINCVMMSVTLEHVAVQGEDIAPRHHALQFAQTPDSH
jgi:3-oxoacyl-[acyl-carrier-protein] synthase-3